MLTPEQIADQLVQDVTYIGSGRVDERDYPDWHALLLAIAASLRAYGAECAAAERERCARVAEVQASGHYMARICAAAIRALD